MKRPRAVRTSAGMPIEARVPSAHSATTRDAIDTRFTAADGQDYVLIDTEHCPVDINFLTSAITAADAAGIVPLVRINDIARSKVLLCGIQIRLFNKRFHLKGIAGFAVFVVLYIAISCLRIVRRNA